MYDSCAGDAHLEGDPDLRVMRFYEELRAAHPDTGADDTSPWASEPLAVGVDHVLMNLRTGDVSDRAIGTILTLADRHGLVVYDPQGDDAYFPRRRG